MRSKGNKNGSINGTNGTRDSGQGSGNEWKWINIPLQDEDAFHLDGSDLTLEFLAGSIASLANDGYGVTIKPTDNGETVCCTIYRPNFPRRGVTIGISGFAGNVRDALLVTMYKFDEKLGGSFTNYTEFDTPNREKSRFR